MNPRLRFEVRSVERNVAVLVVMVYAVGLAAHLLPTTRPLMQAMTPYVLSVFGAVVLFLAAPRCASRGELSRFVLWTVLVVVLTFATEVVGVFTGTIFGSYAYGSVLGVELAEVPLVIGFNWSLVVLGSVSTAELLLGRLLLRTRNTVRRRVGLLGFVLLSGALATLFDVFMEPSAVRLGYWSWNDSTIPVRNYLAWFLLSGFASLLYLLFRIRRRSSIAVVYLVVQACFFVALDLALITTRS